MFNAIIRDISPQMANCELTHLERQPIDIQLAVSQHKACLLYTSPSPRDRTRSRMPSSA